MDKKEIDRANQAMYDHLDIEFLNMKEKSVYVLRINDLYAGVYCHFALCKYEKKKWYWISLNQDKASDWYVSQPMPKWKTIKWAKDMGIVTRIKIYPNHSPVVSKLD